MSLSTTVGFSPAFAFLIALDSILWISSPFPFKRLPYKRWQFGNIPDLMDALEKRCMHTGRLPHPCVFRSVISGFVYLIYLTAFFVHLIRGIQWPTWDSHRTITLTALCLQLKRMERCPDLFNYHFWR